MTIFFLLSIRRPPLFSPRRGRGICYIKPPGEVRCLLSVINADPGAGGDGQPAPDVGMAGQSVAEVQGGIVHQKSVVLPGDSETLAQLAGAVEESPAAGGGEGGIVRAEAAAGDLVQALHRDRAADQHR